MSIERPKGAEQFDDRYWSDFRARARQRASMQRTLLIGGAMVIIAGVLLVLPMDYRVGGIPVQPPFTLLFPGLSLVAGLAITVRAARWLRSDRRTRQ